MRDTDPDLVPVIHTPAEIDAKETARDRLDAWNDRNAWVRWSALVVGLLLIAGAVIRWCEG